MKNLKPRAAHHLLALSVFTLGMLLSGVAQAGFTVCATGKVTTIDSGSTIPSGPNAGDTEDYWNTADSGLAIPAAGIGITVQHPTLGTDFEWADSSGCAFFSSPGATTGFTVTMESVTSDVGNGNYVRLHNDPYSFTSTPGAVWAYVFTNQTLTQNTTATYTQIGSGIAKWTAFFTANFALRKNDDLLSGVALYVGIDESCTTDTEDLASAHYGGAVPNRSNGKISTGTHFLGLANCASTNLTRQKFIVTHEVGHAIAALYYGKTTSAVVVNGDEPNSNDYTNDNDPSRAERRRLHAQRLLWHRHQGVELGHLPRGLCPLDRGVGLE